MKRKENIKVVCRENYRDGQPFFFDFCKNCVQYAKLSIRLFFMKHLTKVLLPFVLFFCMPVAFAGVVDLTTGTKEVYDISVKPIA
jgi:hypothetical protein